MTEIGNRAAACTYHAQMHLTITIKEAEGGQIKRAGPVLKTIISNVEKESDPTCWAVNIRVEIVVNHSGKDMKNEGKQTRKNRKDLSGGSAASFKRGKERMRSRGGGEKKPLALPSRRLFKKRAPGRE